MLLIQSMLINLTTVSGVELMSICFINRVSGRLQVFMKQAFLILVLVASTAHAQNVGTGESYNGKFCAGEGDANYLRLIDESFAFLDPTPVVPNLSMLYKPEWDTFVEGAGWGAWWMQNSYGFSYAASPFLREPWISVLQNSLDLFWDNQGDGKRTGYGGGKQRGMWQGDLFPLAQLVGPDGCLGDMAAPGQIAYRQGDGDVSMHDWFYEATAAGVLMQAEVFLVSRDQTTIERYLPQMERACDFIERTRDPENNLFLVGPASNLLAPSFGGVKQGDGSFGKSYLAGLSITYLAALDRMVELYKLLNNKEERRNEYERRVAMTRASLPRLLTGGGYFAKSLEPGGVQHGVLGQKQFGYLEGVANADAVALRVVDDKIATTIYERISSFPEIRPFDFLLTNAPALDDTYWSWGSASGAKAQEGFNRFGDWVNGGAWGTVEGRAILMYYRLRKYDDVWRSAIRAMKWAKDFRMDAPFSQRGENTNNPWSDAGEHRVGSVVVMVDNFAIPAATIRGLFDYEYRSDHLKLRPRLPSSVHFYRQKHPVSFGGKNLYISCRNGGVKVVSVTVNGRPVTVTSPEEVILYFRELPDNAEVEITTKGGGPVDKWSDLPYPSLPSLISVTDNRNVTTPMPDSLQRAFSVLSKMQTHLSHITGAEKERAFVASAMKAFDAYRVRLSLDSGPGYYRAITAQREKDINTFYAQSAMNMYQGLERRMALYVYNGGAKEKKLAALFYRTVEHQ